MPYFDVLYLDPAWRYANVKTGGSHTSGAAQKYKTMALREIADMPIKEIANPKGSVCFLWATVPFGSDPYEILYEWGFEYKTEWFWHKTGRMGTGYWTRGTVEKLLIGTRGKVKAWRSSLDNWLDEEFPDEAASVLTAKPEGHSRKPEQVIRRIEQLTLDAGRRCELFATRESAARANRFYEEPRPPGTPTPWECYGLDLGHDFRNPRFWTPLIESCKA